MTKIKNTQGINLIVMHPIAYNICDLGGDTYKSKLEITFVPDEYYPDYMEVQSWIAKNIDGKRLNIEDVVKVVHDFISKEYKPKEMSIASRIRDCRTHFDVEVYK